MENLLQTLVNDYIWALIISIFIIFTLIGFFVDRSQIKKRKQKEKNEQKVDEDEEFIIPDRHKKDVYAPIDVNNIPEEDDESEEVYNTKEMSKSFLKEDNYDLSNLLKESISESKEKQTMDEEKPALEDKKSEIMTEKQPKTAYDRNLEYLLREKEKEKEEPKDDIESIDDFLQRTMREAYQPASQKEVKENRVEKQQIKKEKRLDSTNIDYEDTLPIPVQKEQEFSPLEVTVVDPEFYKEYAVKPKIRKVEGYKDEIKKDIDFKPIEDAILESLDKLGAVEESKDSK